MQADELIIVIILLKNECNYLVFNCMIGYRLWSNLYSTFTQKESNIASKTKMNVKMACSEQKFLGRLCNFITMFVCFLIKP